MKPVDKGGPAWVALVEAVAAAVSAVRIVVVVRVFVVWISGVTRILIPGHVLLGQSGYKREA